MMAPSRGKTERVRQVENWLRKKFPVPRSTTVRFFDLKRGKRDCPDAITIRKGRGIYILIHSKLNTVEAVYCLLEEWAHAITWPLASHEHRVADHSAEWGIVYAQIKTAYYDQKGWEESRDYPAT